MLLMRLSLTFESVFLFFLEDESLRKLSEGLRQDSLATSTRQTTSEEKR